MTRFARQVLCALPIALAAGGCSSTMKPGVVGASGRYETGAAVAADDFTVVAPFAADKYKMVVVLPFTESNRANDFFYQSIINAHKFAKVMNKSDVETYIVQQKIDGITDASSILSLHALAAKTGDFLVVKPYVEWKGGYNYEASIEAIDANSAQSVFKAKKKAFNWGGLDKPLLYPLLNAFLDWTAGQRPSAPAPKA